MSVFAIFVVIVTLAFLGYIGYVMWGDVRVKPENKSSDTEEYEVEADDDLDNAKVVEEIDGSVAIDGTRTSELSQTQLKPSVVANGGVDETGGTDTPKDGLKLSPNMELAMKSADDELETAEVLHHVLCEAPDEPNNMIRIVVQPVGMSPHI